MDEEEDDIDDVRGLIRKMFRFVFVPVIRQTSFIFLPFKIVKCFEVIIYWFNNFSRLVRGMMSFALIDTKLVLKVQNSILKCSVVDYPAMLAMKQGRRRGIQMQHHMDS